MRCPYCKRNPTRVVDSRTSGERFVIRRRRLCTRCKKRFTTYEKAEEPALFVTKKDGRREPYDRQKIRRGVLTACTKREISIEKIDDLVGRIEIEIFRRYEREVPSRVVGDLVMGELRDLDHVAYVRFASVYREFKDPSEFMKELRPILR